MHAVNCFFVRFPQPYETGMPCLSCFSPSHVTCHKHRNFPGGDRFTPNHPRASSICNRMPIRTRELLLNAVCSNPLHCTVYLHQRSVHFDLEKQGTLCCGSRSIDLHRSSMKTLAIPVDCLTFILLIVSASASNCSNFQGLDACVGNQTEYARIVSVMFYL